MQVRTYKVAHTRDEDTGDYLKFFVTDVHTNDELKKGRRPDIAVFPVSQLYDEEEQRQRAEHYAEYMDRLQEAKQRAYDNELLIDIIKGKEKQVA